MNRSWTEVQALGVRAATGIGVPPAQALAFGGMLARHLADCGAEAPIFRVLDLPETIVALAHRIEHIVERTSLTACVVTESEQDAGRRALFASWLHALPCQVTVAVHGRNVSSHLNLAAPSALTRPDRVSLSKVLFQKLSDLAAPTYVPDSDESRAMGAGADMMELD